MHKDISWKHKSASVYFFNPRGNVAHFLAEALGFRVTS